MEVRLDTNVIQQRCNLENLRPIIQKNGEIDEDFTHRIDACWMKLRLVFGVFCNKNVSFRLKDKFYTVVVKPIMLYKKDCWLFKNSHIQKMKVTKMKIL